jgi:hypothetical protein
LIVCSLDNVFCIKRSREARPTGTGFIFVFGAEKWLSGDDIDIDAILMIVPVLITVRRLGTIVLCDVVLERGKKRAEFGVGGFGVGRCRRNGTGK